LPLRRVKRGCPHLAWTNYTSRCGRPGRIPSPIPNSDADLTCRNTFCGYSESKGNQGTYLVPYYTELPTTGWLGWGVLTTVLITVLITVLVISWYLSDFTVCHAKYELTMTHS